MVRSTNSSGGPRGGKRGGAGITEADPKSCVLTDWGGGVGAKAFIDRSLCKLVQELEVGLALGCSCWNEVATRVGESDGSSESASQLHTLLRGDDTVSVPENME